MTAAGFRPTRRKLLALYRRLLARYGDLAWWPGDSPFEIMVGAVLTQNTAWTNVEKALRQLRAADAVSPAAILALPDARLGALIRPSGYYNVKAQRLKALCRFLQACGGEAGLVELDTPALRAAVLAVKGVGPETCDDILLYALDRPVFVIDSYTRRLLRRLGLAAGDEPYDVLRRGFEQALGPDVGLYKAFHGLVVEHGKLTCTARPRCNACCLSRSCAKRP